MFEDVDVRSPFIACLPPHGIEDRNFTDRGTAGRGGGIWRPLCIDLSPKEKTWDHLCAEHPWQKMAIELKNRVECRDRDTYPTTAATELGIALKRSCLLGGRFA